MGRAHENGSVQVQRRSTATCLVTYLAPTHPTHALLQVPDELLIDRVVGRRSDPQTGEIYHLSFKPPPPEIVGRLVGGCGGCGGGMWEGGWQAFVLRCACVASKRGRQAPLAQPGGLSAACPPSPPPPTCSVV